MPTETRRRPPGFFGGEARSDSSDERVSLFSFLSPRYWKTWIFITWMKASSLLPWRWSLALHKQLGRWLGKKSRKSVALVRENLEVCFPELNDSQRDTIASDYFANMGALVTEIALAWFRSPEQVRKLITAEGTEHLDEALSRGRGVILFLGHFTTMEMCGVGVGAYVPHFVITHNKRRSRLLSEFQRRGRERLGDEVFAKHNVRGLLRSLRNNGVVWFAGDEANAGKSSAMLPFFGKPAPTNVALSRLARITGSAVVPLTYGRKADDSGYSLRFEPALMDFPTADPIADTRRLVTILEDQIREYPAQYFWKQKRFQPLREKEPD